MIEKKSSEAERTAPSFPEATIPKAAIVSRANRQGFLDHEPPSPDRAAASCHVGLIGDSFVEAREVPVADKVRVRLEALAGRRLFHLDVTTSAFGIRGTGRSRKTGEGYGLLSESEWE